MSKTPAPQSFSTTCRSPLTKSPHALASDEPLSTATQTCGPSSKNTAPVAAKHSSALRLPDIRTSFPQDQQSPLDVDHQGSTRGVRVERFVDDAPSVVDQDERQVVAVPDARGWKARPSFAASPSIIPS